MERIYIENTAKYEGKDMVVAGWVNARRDHGKLIFIDLRDMTGILQVVFSPTEEETYKKAKSLRSEWVVKIRGKVKSRPEEMKNPNIISGDFELGATELEVLSQAQTSPFALDTDGYEINEELRWKHRYLDMRRDRVAKILRARHHVKQAMRTFLTKREFIEVDTPILTKSTPEGARDFLVPSRHYPGKFYALPQSPQQYKQLLMVGGVEKYFQIARCFRDEDLRNDRLFEFDQLDIEMSFIEQEDILKITEELVTHVT